MLLDNNRNTSHDNGNSSNAFSIPVLWSIITTNSSALAECLLLLAAGGCGSLQLPALLWSIGPDITSLGKEDSEHKIFLFDSILNWGPSVTVYGRYLCLSQSLQQ